MAKPTYREMLLDPRWQKKRLEILARDEFTCQDCKSKAKTLHVHHLVYFSGKAPWDYDDWALVTLCHECHEHLDGHSKRLVVAAAELFAFDSDAVNALAVGLEKAKSIGADGVIVFVGGVDLCSEKLVTQCLRLEQGFVPEKEVARLIESRLQPCDADFTENALSANGV